MTPAQAQTELNNLLPQLQAQFPTAGITFGYIGNNECLRDDRLWRLFTTLQWAGLWGVERASWGSYATKDLPRMLDDVRAGKFAEFITRLAAPKS